MQHAHQKGVIHRDLKPSNVLVTLHDGTPVVKVIDFGIAKATGQQLTDKTVFTNFAQMVGTPLYMSPEQAGMSGLDIDTRTDIYSLGVLLYELLTGTTPFDKERLWQASYDEMRRIIREEEPPRPSTRMSTLAQAGTTVSTQRKSDPKRLSQLFRGEVAWMVMKALEKDRNRRYETASAFAADVQRYLADEPVQACPPSAWYRFRKFARRNRGAVAVIGLVLFFLVLLGSGVGWTVRDQAAREQERSRERVERQARVAGKIELILQEVKRLERQEKWPEALDAAKRAEAALASGEADPATRDKVEAVITDLEWVRRLEEIQLDWSELSYDRVIADKEIAQRYAAAFRESGVDVEALPAAAAAARLRARPAVVVALAQALDTWALCRRRTGDEAQAGKLWSLAATIDRDSWRANVRQAIAAKNTEALDKLAQSAEAAGQPPMSQVLLAGCLRATSRPEQAVALLEQACERYPSDFWVHHELAWSNYNLRPKRLEAAVRHYVATRTLRPRSSSTWNNLGTTLRRQRKHHKAIACFRKAIDLDRKNASAHAHLAGSLGAQGKRDEAIALCKKALDLDPKSVAAHVNLGALLDEQGKRDEAVACYRKALALDPQCAVAHYNLGNTLSDQGKRDEAVACYRKALDLDPDYAMAHVNLGILLMVQGKRDEAIDHFRKAIEFDPLCVEAPIWLGNARCDEGKYAEAIACYRKALELEPNNVNAHYSLGRALGALNKVEETIAAYWKAIQLKPDHVPALNDLGNLLSGPKADYDGAIAA